MIASDVRGGLIVAERSSILDLDSQYNTVVPERNYMAVTMDMLTSAFSRGDLIATTLL